MSTTPRVVPEARKPAPVQREWAYDRRRLLCRPALEDSLSRDGEPPLRIPADSPVLWETPPRRLAVE